MGSCLILELWAHPFTVAWTNDNGNIFSPPTTFTVEYILIENILLHQELSHNLFSTPKVWSFSALSGAVRENLS